MPTNIDQLQIEVTTKSNDAVIGLKELKKILQSVNRVAKSSGLDDLTTKLEKISKINFSNLKQLNGLGNTLKQVNRLTKDVKDLSDKMSKIPAPSGGSDVSEIDPVREPVSGVPKEIRVPVNTPGIDNAQKKASIFSRTLDRIRAASSKATAGLKTLSSRLRNASSAFSSASKKASELSKVLKIVLVYGGAFRAVMMLTQGVSEGLQNLAQYNNETAAAMSRLSTMSLYLKNSIAAALYPVIVALTPALQTMTNAIVRAFEAMGQLVSLLSGKSTYLKAKEYMKSYVDTAKKSANEVKKSFAGMDEITVIGQKDSGASAGGENYGAMFEEVPIDNPKLEALLPFFEGLGKVLSSCFDTVKRLANDYLYPWLVNLGNWCAENPDTLESIGKGLGYVVVGIVALKSAIKVVNLLISPFLTLQKVLSALGIPFKMFSGIVVTIAGLIMYVSNLVDIFKEGANGANLLGAAIGAIITTLGAFLIAIAVSASATTAGIVALVVAIVAVVGMLVAVIVSHWEEISAFFVNLWSTITTFFTNIWTSIVEFFSGVASWVNDNILQPIIAFFTPFVTAIIGFFQAIWSVVSSVFSTIWSIVSTVFSAIYDVVSHVIGTIIEIIVGLGEAVWAVISKIYEIISTIVQMIWAVISWLFGLVWDFISKIATWIWDNALKPILDFVTNLVTKIVEKFTSIVNTIKTKVIDPILGFFENLVKKVVGFFKNIAISVVDAISGTFKSVLNGAFSIVEKVVNFFIKGINGAIGIINNIPGVDIKKIDLLSIPRFATGGFPEDGLFMANHGELVGQFSNGKTAVANNEQIVEGITGGVYAANQEQNSLLREQNKLLRQLVEDKSNGQIDVTTITSAIQRKNRRDGKTIVPVGV